MRKIIYIVLLGLITLTACSSGNDDDSPIISFLVSGSEVNSLSRNDLKAELTSHAISYYDTVHHKTKNMQAFLLKEVLEFGFSTDLSTKPNATLTFVALDGFQDTANGSQAVETGGYVAFEDLDIEGSENWELVATENNNNPAPFYVVWTGSDQVPVNSYPWPYKLFAINLEE